MSETELEETTVGTDRLDQHVRLAGEGATVLLVHGNLSDGAVWAEQMARLPAGFRGVAPDLRGYGRTDPEPVDARRGVGDWVDDLVALADRLELGPLHLVGHSLGGGVVMGLALAHPDRVASITLVDPVSPYGYGGTRLDGSPCQPDFAGSGAGAVNPELVERVQRGDRSTDSAFSPRNVVRTLYFPSEEVVRHEETLVDGILSTRVGDDHWPGEARSSEHWPGVAPGDRGVLNAISPAHFDATALATDGPDVPLLWVRGAQDAIVSDAAMTDLGHLGAIGMVPGWPGEDVFPPQPMVRQTRRVLEGYGDHREEVFEASGHFPYIQEPDRFADLLAEHLDASRS